MSEKKTNYMRHDMANLVFNTRRYNAGVLIYKLVWFLKIPFTKTLWLSFKIKPPTKPLQLKQDYLNYRLLN